MFDVLAFVYDNYLDPDTCPELPALHRTLNTVGFAYRDVETALLWLEGLQKAVNHLPSNSAPKTAIAPFNAAARPLTRSEQTRLGVKGWGFLTFLVSAGALTNDELELVMDRAMAASGAPLSLEALKMIVLMVFWGLAREPDALVLDELCADRAHLTMH